MKARKTIIALGTAWDGARFFILLSIALWLFISASGWGTSIAAWLIAASAAGLLLPVGELLYCLYPGRYGNLIGFLLLAKILNVFSLLLLFFSGALSSGIGTILFRVGELGVSQTAACSAIAVLDLLSLMSLGAIGTAPEAKDRKKDVEPELPRYSEEEIKDYH
jgi:hypothetical protein